MHAAILSYRGFLYICVIDNHNSNIMSQISDLILQQVKNAVGGVEVPSNVQETVVSGLSNSILSSLTQTATAPGGIDLIKNLVSGKASPITALATKLFTGNILSKLNLGKGLGAALTALIPTILGKVGGILKDRDGDGDVDLNDIILTLTGGGNATAKKSGAGILGAATSILGSILGKK